MTSSLYGPSGYATSRYQPQTNGDGQAASATTMVHVEDRPYFPFLIMDPANESSMLDISATIMHAYYASKRPQDSEEASGAQDMNKGEFGEGQITKVSGGLTNALFKIDFPKRSVLIRIFGAEGMIDRDLETATFARLCGPPHNNGGSNSDSGSSEKVVHSQLDLIGRFANGRIESWIPNMRQSVLTDYDSDLMKGVARVLARLHYGFEIPSYLYSVECRSHEDGRRERVRCLRPSLWDVIYSWIDELEGVLSREEFKDRELMQLFCEAIMGSTNKDATKDDITSHLMQETEWLQSKLREEHPNATVAFTHNDLCTANILLDKKCQDTEPCIIDYEYAAVGYALYDVANFFCELCGGNDNGIPNIDLFPSSNRQTEFLNEYALEKTKILQQKGEKEAECVTSEMLSQIQLFQMASNLIWGVWGVLQACGEVTHEAFCKKDAKVKMNGKIEVDSFDNLRYGMNRLKNYRLCKTEL